MNYTITNFQDLLDETLGKSKELTTYEIKNLTAPGENYGSLMLAVKVDLREKATGKEESLHLIAKTAPTSEFIQQMFQSRFSFKKELEFYRTIVPTLRQFQKSQGVTKTIDFVAEFYGGRTSINPQLQFDKEAIILLENLKISGYEIGDRFVGLNYECTKLVLEDLAVLHAVPVALKLKQPSVFKDNVFPYLKNASFFTGLGPGPIKAMVNDAADLLRQTEEFKVQAELLEEVFNRGEAYRINPVAPKEPFATIAHSDFWVNNTMLLLKDGKPIKNKMVDFQLTEYNSPAKDFIFFMFISVQNQIIIDHFDELFQFYYDTYIDTLKKHNVDISKFSLNEFLADMDTAAKQDTVLQCIVMLRPIFAPKGVHLNFEIMDENTKLREPTETHKEKLYFLIRELTKRNWL